MRLSRRQWMRWVGGGLGGGLLLPSLSAHSAKAQQAPIRRVVLFVSQHGTVRDNWSMRRANPAYREWEYPLDNGDPASFSPILRPLHAHREHLLVLEGLSQASTLGDRATNNHDAARQHLLTGAAMVDDFSAGGPSVDQVIAGAVSRAEQLPSLELSTGGLGGGGSFVHSLSHQKVTPEAKPQAVLQRLFPRAGVGLGTEARDPNSEALVRARQRMLRFVAGEYGRVAGRLSSEDRLKLELHEDLLGGLSRRYGREASRSCSAPEALGTDSAGQLATGRSMAELTAAAFACDLTRVVTLQVGQLSNSEFGAPPGDVHADFAHQTLTNPDAAAWMTQYNLKHSELFAYLLGQLQSYSDGAGSLLDNTAVLWVSELANGPHELDKIPVVVAGGAGGAFRTGRYVSYANELPNPFQFPNWGPEVRRPIGPGLTHLWISLMQAMGMSQSSLGMTQVVTRDGNGTVLDLTGPLARLS